MGQTVYNTALLMDSKAKTLQFLGSIHKPHAPAEGKRFSHLCCMCWPPSLLWALKVFWGMVGVKNLAAKTNKKLWKKKTTTKSRKTQVVWGFKLRKHVTQWHHWRFWRVHWWKKKKGYSNKINILWWLYQTVLKHFVTASLLSNLHKRAVGTHFG